MRDTGKSLNDWIKIAKTCPETRHKARLAWFKSKHGLGVNRASLILNATFKTGLGWDNPNALLDQLWKTPEKRAVYDLVQAIVKGFGEDVVVGPRKGFSAFSRRFQFAALRPTRTVIRMGLAVPLESAPNAIAPISSDSWSDRLTAVYLLTCSEDIDENIKAMLQAAYQTSG